MAVVAAEGEGEEEGWLRAPAAVVCRHLPRLALWLELRVLEEEEEAVAWAAAPPLQDLPRGRQSDPPKPLRR